jgi:glycosyltransferase involved in cell wall biosynthesis
MSDELLAVLSELQANNDQLLQALYRERMSAIDAAEQLRDVHRSWAHRLFVLALGQQSGVRRRFLRLLRKTLQTVKHHGVRGLTSRIWSRIRLRLARLANLPTACDIDPSVCSFNVVWQQAYERWIALREPDAAALEKQRRTPLSHEPLISIVVPVYRTPLGFLIAMIESVRAQTRANWQLCLANGGGDPIVQAILDSYRCRDDRIVVKHLAENRGIAGNTNAALEIATGEFVAFLDHDDTLAPFALHEVARAIGSHPEADLLYSDEDKIDQQGLQRFDAFFKPAWSPETLRSYNYVCHLAVYRHELLRRLGGVRAGFDGSQDHDLVLRASECCRQIVHIPQVLYHWREHGESTARHTGLKPEAAAAGKRAVAEHLERVGITAEVTDEPNRLAYQVKYTLPRQPLVSVLIPNKDSRHILDTCLRSLEQSTYRNLEILIIENNSTDRATFDYYRQFASKPQVRVLTWKEGFNYGAINNWGAAQAQGEVLLLLNNDTEAINPDWIERMLEHAIREEVGGVGAKLFFPDGTIQHAGVVVGMGGVAGHIYRGFPGDHQGNRYRLLVAQNVSAVTAACFMLRKEVFDEVGGFDERFGVAFNDVDLCLKIRKQEKLLVWTPFAQLWHHESKTRGAEDTPAKQVRFAREVQLFHEKWDDFLAQGDPYFSPNLSLSITDCSADLRPARSNHPRSVTLSQQAGLSSQSDAA